VKAVVSEYNTFGHVLSWTKIAEKMEKVVDYKKIFPRTPSAVCYCLYIVLILHMCIAHTLIHCLQLSDHHHRAYQRGNKPLDSVASITQYGTALTTTFVTMVEGMSSMVNDVSGKATTMAMNITSDLTSMVGATNELAKGYVEVANVTSDFLREQSAR